MDSRHDRCRSRRKLLLNCYQPLHCLDLVGLIDACKLILALAPMYWAVCSSSKEQTTRYSCLVIWNFDCRYRYLLKLDWLQFGGGYTVNAPRTLWELAQSLFAVAYKLPTVVASGCSWISCTEITFQICIGRLLYLDKILFQPVAIENCEMCH